jgi:O-antigen/teichoic acid export membrane protein
VTHPAGLARGTVQVMGAESLALPAGLIMAAYLGRALGPADYGLFMVAASIITTLQWTIGQVFARATVRLVGEADDWRAAGSAVLRAQAALGLIVAAGVWASAGFLAHQLAEPRLATLLRWFALEIPIAAANVACRNVLTGRREYGARALAGAARSVGRPLFVIAFVAAGWSVIGAVAGSVAAALAIHAVAQGLARVPLGRPASFPTRRLWQLAVPMFILALSLRLIDRIGLLAVKFFGGTTADAGWFAAAQNFTVPPALFAMSFSPLLLASLTPAWLRQDHDEVARTGRLALRVVMLLAPGAALAAGAAAEIIRFIYGPAFEPAAVLAPPLLVAAVALMLVSVASALLMAADRTRLASACLWPVLPGTVVAHMLVVPAHGALGAAMVTAAATAVAALASLALVGFALGIRAPGTTLLRSLVVAAGAFVLAASWPTAGVWLLAKALVGCTLVGVALAALGEFDADDVARLRRIIGTPGGHRPVPRSSG